MAWFEGISTFFNWLMGGITGIWNTFSLVVIFVILIAVQVAFFYIYFRIGMLVMKIYPTIKDIVRRLNEWAS